MRQRGKAARIKPAPCYPIVETPSPLGAHSVRVQGGFFVVFIRPDYSFEPFPSGACRRTWT